MLNQNEERILNYIKIRNNLLEIDAKLVLPNNKPIDKIDEISRAISHAKHLKPIIEQLINLEKHIPDNRKQPWW